MLADYLRCLWPGGDFLLVGIAHAAGAHRILGKRPDGTLPCWSWLVFLPLLLYTSAVWHVIRLVSREPSQNAVTGELTVGRRLLPFELHQDFDNYVDLTAEFPEPAAIRRSNSYCCFPILDGASPTPDALAEAVDRLQPGKTFIHCAKGHGRTGLFALAVLLRLKKARTVEDGLRLLKAARPGISLSRAQRKCIEAFAQRLGYRAD
jgi:protein-tyrosine phosphatase